MKRVLFVCTGNVCRSPMAEALFRQLLEGREDVEVASAGVAAMPGQPASSHTADIVNEVGASLEGFASQLVDPELLDWSTHIVGMTGTHLGTIASHFPEQEDKLFLATEFCSDDAIRSGGVPDPIGMGRGAYEATRNTLQKALPDFLAFLDHSSSTSSESDA